MFEHGILQPGRGHKCTKVSTAFSEKALTLLARLTLLVPAMALILVGWGGVFPLVLQI